MKMESTLELKITLVGEEKNYIKNQIKELLDEKKSKEEKIDEGFLPKDKGSNTLIEFLQKIQVRL